MRHILTVEQRTEAWFAARAGILTASVAHVPAMQGRKKGEESTTRRDLKMKLALERINGRAIEETFQGNADTERGVALEAEALAAYEAKTGEMLSRVGFVYRDDLPIGCSPDGVVLEYDHNILGGVDVKCPRPANHDAYRCDPSLLVAEYEAQIAHTLLVTGAPWWDLASYCPVMPPSLRLVIVRLVPSGPVGAPMQTGARALDVEAHDALVRAFLAEVDEKAAAIQRAAQEAM